MKFNTEWVSTGTGGGEAEHSLNVKYHFIFSNNTWGSGCCGLFGLFQCCKRVKNSCTKVYFSYCSVIQPIFLQCVTTEAFFLINPKQHFSIKITAMNNSEGAFVTLCVKCKPKSGEG